MTPDAIACDVLMHAYNVAHACACIARRQGRIDEAVGAMAVANMILDIAEATEARLNAMDEAA